jgi:hypothetical protein
MDKVRIIVNHILLGKNRNKKFDFTMTDEEISKVARIVTRQFSKEQELKRGVASKADKNYQPLTNK